jgi:hypothetical protein
MEDQTVHRISFVNAFEMEMRIILDRYGANADGQTSGHDLPLLCTLLTKKGTE